MGKRNTPTIVGASYNSWFFLDGRTDSLWSQALGPWESELEHGGDRSQFAHLLYRSPNLRSQYEELFGKLPNLTDQNRFRKRADLVSNKRIQQSWTQMAPADQARVTTIFTNLAKAIAAFEARIKPTAARFDRYVAAALAANKKEMSDLYSDTEAAGLRLFISKAMCIMCHSGPLFSDSDFHNINTLVLRKKPYDWGRYDGAQQVLTNEFNCYSRFNDSTDKSCHELRFMLKSKQHTIGSFKTPSLRNVSKTAPYMHSGQFDSLTAVLQHYSDPPKKIIGKSNLLKVKLNSLEREQLEAFLHTLDSPISDY